MAVNFPSRQVPHSSTVAAERQWWNTTPFVVMAILLSAVPLLWPAIPPLIDLPSHMGTYHIALNGDTSASLRKYYEFHWQVLGNLGVELLVIPFAKMLGVELGTKIVVILIPVLTVAGMLWVAREIHDELPPTAGFALPLAYGYPLQFGFVNYCLSMALMLIGFAWWLRLSRRDKHLLRAVVFALFAVVLWLTHAIGWALLVIACGCSELHRRIGRGEAWPAAMARTALACLPLCAPLLVMASLPHHRPSTFAGWFLLPELVKWLAMLLRDRWRVLDLISAGTLFALLAIAAARRGGMRFQWGLAFPGLALLATFVVAPQSISDSGYVNGRIATYAVALLVLAIGMSRASAFQRRNLAIAASAFFVLRIVASAASMALYSASYAANLEALPHIEPGSTVVALSPVPCGHSLANWWTPRVYHLPSMAIVRRDAFVNTEWQIDGLQLLRAKYPAAKPFDADPSQMVTLECGDIGYRQYRVALETFPRAAFDYLWLLEIPRDQWPVEPGLKLVWSHDRSALYRIAH